MTIRQTVCDTPPMTTLADLTRAERAILDAVRRAPGTSRADISAGLGLSPAMLTKSVTGFLEAGLLQEERDRMSRGRGQPALRLRLRERAAGAFGISLSTSGVSVVAADLAGGTLAQQRFDLSAERTNDVCDAAEAAIREMSGLADSWCGIGLWLPALQDEAGTVVEVTPSQSGIDHATIRAELSRRLAADVWLESKAPALHEAMHSAGDGVVFMLLLDYGVGGSVIDHMRLFRGGFGEACNIGALLPDTGIRPALPDLAKHLGLARSALTPTHLQDLANEMPESLTDWIASRGQSLSMPLTTVVHLINPTSIVVGGLFPAAILEGLISEVRLDLLDHPGRRPLTKPDLRVATVTGADAMAVAAASIPFARRLVSPA